MPTFQGTFEDRIGKFKAGNTLIQSWADYNSTNPFIAKAGLPAFITSIENSNLNVINKLDIVGQKQRDRLPLCFIVYDNNTEVGIINPDCAVLRIIGVHAYVKSLFPSGAKKVDLLKAIVDKIRPQYKGATGVKSFTIAAGQSIVVNNVVNGSNATNTGTTNLEWNEVGGTNVPAPILPGETETIIAPSGVVLIKNFSTLKAGKIKMVVKTGKLQSKSPAEKTFASIEGFMSETIQLVSTFGGGIVYSPPDPKLTIAELTILRNQITVANAQVSDTLEDYGDANRARKLLYDGLNGMADRITMIKNYLASFPLKKKSSHFIEFSQAIKGV